MPTFDELVTSFIELFRDVEYSDDQKRADDGKWTDGGGSASKGKKSASTNKAISNHSGGKVPKKDIDQISNQWDGRRKGVALGTITSRSKNDVVLLKDGNEVVGVVGFRPDHLVFKPPDVPKGDYAYIDGIATKRSGLGKETMQIAIDKAKSDGKGLLLSANDDVIGFYKKLGMKQTKSNDRIFYFTPEQIKKM